MKTTLLIAVARLMMAAAFVVLQTTSLAVVATQASAPSEEPSPSGDQKPTSEESTSSSEKAHEAQATRLRMRRGAPMLAYLTAPGWLHPSFRPSRSTVFAFEPAPPARLASRSVRLLL